MYKFKNIRVIDPLNNRDEITDLYINHNGCIVDSCEVEKEIDGTGKIACPGFVDVHVHFRDPGQTYKEDLITGSICAIRGGYSHVVCMANTIPVIDSIELYMNNTLRMQDLPLNVYQAVAISKGFKGVELTDMDGLKSAGAIFFTDDGLPLKDQEFVRKAMLKAKELSIPLSFHEEDPTYIGKAGVNEGKISKQLGFVGADRLAESVITKRDIELAKETGATINIQHISSKEAVELVRQAKKEGIHVHAEACPHHFTLTEDAVLIHGSLAKMNPPLREEEDRIAICEGLKDGTIDIIATDHAPHSDEEKAKELMSCPSGILGLETAYSLANEMLVDKGYLTYTSLVERMSVNPGKLIGVRCALDVNEVVNMVIIDPNEEWVYKESVSKSNNSPFLNRKMKGKVIMTFAKGKCVYM